ncbi:hypothetical protein DEJ46_36420 [Streptomyces venezuelae]|uniref:Uncharacterized protein n=1 Tax=Streptomyces venezuelae TaxID=54571 RepID=A0A5P2B1L6_STRVZ|nr:hypothetical protein DEJ46_36420 [Streptomyces venezuelae]
MSGSLSRDELHRAVGVLRQGERGPAEGGSEVSGRASTADDQQVCVARCAHESPGHAAAVPSFGVHGEIRELLPGAVRDRGRYAYVITGDIGEFRDDRRLGLWFRPSLLLTRSGDSFHPGSRPRAA